MTLLAVSFVVNGEAKETAHTLLLRFFGVKATDITAWFFIQQLLHILEMT